MGITELLELRRQNLLTDEELAFAIKERKKKVIIVSYHKKIKKLLKELIMIQSELLI